MKKLNMKKFLLALILFLPLSASAITVPWEKPNGEDRIHPLYINDVVLVGTTSTSTNDSIFEVSGTSILATTTTDRLTVGSDSVTSLTGPGLSVVSDALTVDDVDTLSTSLSTGSVAFSDGSTLTEDNSNFFWDDTNNRLGIGTSTPKQSIHAHTTGGSAVFVAQQGDGNYAALNAGGVNASFRFNENFNFTIDKTSSTTDVIPNFKFLYANGSTNDLQFNEGVVHIDGTDNNVGIGATSTDAGDKLTVDGDVAVSGLVQIIDPTRGYILTSGISETPRYGLKYGTAGNSGGSDHLMLTNREASGDLLFGVSGATGGGGGEIEAMRITSTGNIGIGETSPDSKLHISGDTASDIQSIIQGASSQSANLTEWQDSAGNVTAAIGKNTSTSTLKLGDSSMPGQIEMGDSDGVGVSCIQVNDGTLSASDGACN